MRDTAAHAFLSSLRLDLVRAPRCRLFILDHHMPAPDGIEMIGSFAHRTLLTHPDRNRDGNARARGAPARAASRSERFIEKPLDYQELVSRISTLLALQDARRRLEMNVESLEGSLVEAEARSRDHAERLEALWRIVSNPGLREEEMLHAMLRQGALRFAPGTSFTAAFEDRWFGDRRRGQL